jgi:hypothetical protein
MLRDIARKLAAPVLKRIDARIEIKVSQALQNRVAADGKKGPVQAGWSPELEASLEQRIDDAIHKRLFLPSFPPLFDAQHTFMKYSTCSAADFLHPSFGQLCGEFDYPPSYHRKLWEWVFVIHHLKQAGVLKKGNRGIGFGVGRERLPALFAKYGVQVTATDASEELGKSVGWVKTNEHSSGVTQLLYPSIVDNDIVRSNVTHRACDMNRIDGDLTDFDFTWSCCCFEHLGSLEAGVEFVINSVEKTLKIGGVACHTTEFNLSSDNDTLREGATVLYRKRDMLELVNRLRERGHEVETFSVAPDSHYLDGYVDVPPYADNPHLKLALAGYTTTSVGIVVRRGR